MRVYLMLPLVALLSACSTPPSLQPPAPDIQDSWQAEADIGSASPGWLNTLQDPALEGLVEEAMNNNPGLAAARQSLVSARQQWLATGADAYPQLSLELGARRQENTDRSDSLSLNLSWTPDIWGEMDARTQQAAFTYAAAEAALEEQREELVADVSRTWFEIQEARLLLELYTRRHDTLEQSLDIIETGYRQGLNEALDLYLARNNVNSEAARLEQQRQTLSELQRDLEQTLGRYPAAELSSSGSLPLLDAEVPAGMPADVLRRRPDLQQAWLRLLARDAALAAAHRDRFPSLTLSAAEGGSSDALSDLLRTGNLAWSLGASLTQTLFDAGRKEAVQAQALADRAEQEQLWLEAVYAALTEVENALSERRSLHNRYQLYLKAEQNALNAEALAFEQYRNGLESFTTVLEAQRRSLDAQTNVINLRLQLLHNRIELYRALGGRFSADTTAEPEPDTP